MNDLLSLKGLAWLEILYPTNALVNNNPRSHSVVFCSITQQNESFVIARQAIPGHPNAALQQDERFFTPSHLGTCNIALEIPETPEDAT